jgi:hypothetical protein
MSMKKYFAVAILLASCVPAFAWDDGGHMLVARIAYSQMSANAKQQADALLKDLPDERKSTPSAQPRAYDFVSAACWMDDVRGVSKYDRLKPWHYINVPCGGDPRKTKMPGALSALEYSLRVLQSIRYSEKSKAIALAVVLHLVGDIHQPLHCIDTDLGGNTFPISGVPHLRLGLRSDGKFVDKTLPATGENAPIYQRLHAFWDSGYRYDESTQDGEKSLQPLAYLGDSSHPDLARIEVIAADLTTHYLPTDKTELDETDVANWIVESNRIACEFALKTPRERRPSMEYFERAHDESCKRISLAGYRLAKLLNEAFTGA